MGFTPMMQQYFKIKEENKDCIVFYRLGDFYEMFFDDAILASKELEIALTGRDCGMEEKAPMCGVPFHSATFYINKLISKGYKVAICEQLTDPKETKGIVERGVVRIITPGTVIEEEMLDEKSNNFILSAIKNNFTYAISLCDVSTGKFITSEFSGKTAFNLMLKEIIKHNPCEIVCETNSFIDENLNIGINKSTVDTIIYLNCEKKVKQQFNDISNLTKSQIISTGYLLDYLIETQKNDLVHIKNIEVIVPDNFMQIDNNARIHLELFSSINGNKKGSLLNLLDNTQTAMGGRLLKSWLSMPLLDKEKINQRLEAVEEVKNELIISSKLRENLNKVYDIERIISKLTYNTLNARDCIALKKSIKILPETKAILSSMACPLLKSVHDNLDTMEDVFTLLERAINEDAPITIKEGDIIKPSFNAEINELYDICTNSQNILLELEQREKEETGIKNLKLGYNKIFGHYFEVTKSYYDKVPYRYTRKQTLANCERFITSELKEIESKITNANEKRIKLEYAIFEQIRAGLVKQIHRFQLVSDMLSTIDVINSFAILASQNGYVKPNITTDGIIDIKMGKHPIVEQNVKDSFVPNDAYLDTQKERFAIITGPNMSGKSTYMRQVAIITLMAHMGCFVPAKSANITITDKIFTRIGASDNLSQGQSTFMVEMSELANIINNATKNSLVILDEVGRGTSTIDGVSIALSTVMYISSKIGAKTLFATHYHQLSYLEGKVDGVVNYKIAVSEQGDKVVFLHTIKRGGTDKSFGLYVAKLAGLPDDFIHTASSIMNDIVDDVSLDNFDGNIESYTPQYIEQDDYKEKYEELKSIIENIDINNITPLKSFEILSQLKESLE